MTASTRVPGSIPGRRPHRTDSDTSCATWAAGRPPALAGCGGLKLRLRYRSQRPFYHKGFSKNDGPDADAARFVRIADDRRNTLEPVIDDLLSSLTPAISI